ncbi:glycosyltransferase, partial [Candidatus Woesearchaeota archaeon]|nr:glycosyltransferase [Candidatus Woesearchaeota archaeon]
MKLSLLIPAYNEEKRIGKTLSLYLPFLTKKLQKEYELLVVLNGCKDNTLSAVKPFMKKYPQLRYKNIPQAIGKGGAIIEGFKLAKG